VALDSLSRHLYRVPGQDSGFRPQVGGSISDSGAVAIRKPTIGDDKLIASLDQPALGLSHRQGKINDVSGSLQNEQQQPGKMCVIVD